MRLNNNNCSLILLGLLFCHFSVLCEGLPPLRGGLPPLRGLNYGHYAHTETVRVAVEKHVASTPYKKQKKNKSRLQRFLEEVTRGDATPGPIPLQHFLYWLTAFDAVNYVLSNDYEDIVLELLPQPTTKPNMVKSAYIKLFFFARLSPRLLYSVGAMLRAFQLCTPLQSVFDPSIGVGAGVNLCAMLAQSRWIKPLIMGWATTKWVWIWLGARQQPTAFVPITLSLGQHKFKEIKKDDEPKDSN